MEPVDRGPERTKPDVADRSDEKQRNQQGLKKALEVDLAVGPNELEPPESGGGVSLVDHLVNLPLLGRDPRHFAVLHHPFSFDVIPLSGGRRLTIRGGP
jgi:hypothetical protein